jgi:hypothetical protein
VDGNVAPGRHDVRNEKGKADADTKLIKRADSWVSEEGTGSDNHTTPGDRPTSLSAITQDDAQAQELESAI